MLMHALQAVSAMACSPCAQYPPRLAVAMRANKRNARIMVYEILVGADAGSPFGSSALCISQANIAETLTIKVCYPCIIHIHRLRLVPQIVDQKLTAPSGLGYTALKVLDDCQSAAC